MVLPQPNKAVINSPQKSPSPQKPPTKLFKSRSQTSAVPVAQQKEEADYDALPVKHTLNKVPSKQPRTPTPKNIPETDYGFLPESDYCALPYIPKAMELLPESDYSPLPLVLKSRINSAPLEFSNLSQEANDYDNLPIQRVPATKPVPQSSPGKLKLATPVRANVVVPKRTPPSPRTQTTQSYVENHYSVLPNVQTVGDDIYQPININVMQPKYRNY